MLTHLSALLLIFSGFILGVLASGTPVLALYDLASLLMIVLPAAGAAVITTRYRVAFQAMGFCCTGRLPGQANPAEIAKAIAAAAQMAVIAGLVGTLIGVVGIAAWSGPVSNPSHLGKALAASLLSTLYGLIVFGILSAARKKLL